MRAGGTELDDTCPPPAGSFEKRCPGTACPREGPAEGALVALAEPASPSRLQPPVMPRSRETGERSTALWVARRGSRGEPLPFLGKAAYKATPGSSPPPEEEKHRPEAAASGLPCLSAAGLGGPRRLDESSGLEWPREPWKQNWELEGRSGPRSPPSSAAKEPPLSLTDGGVQAQLFPEPPPFALGLAATGGVKGFPKKHGKPFKGRRSPNKRP